MSIFFGKKLFISKIKIKPKLNKLFSTSLGKEWEQDLLRFGNK